jgi:hypothetical protein
MAGINGVQQADAGLKVKLVYRLGPRMMKKPTGREPQAGSGIEPMESWAYQPKMMFGMGKFNQAVRKGKSVDERLKNLVELRGAQMIGVRVMRRPRLADLPQLRLLRRRAAGAGALPRERPVHRT